jgi:uncharacterized protein (UPF0332 family)
LTLGQEPRTHGGVDRLLQRDLVRAGQFDPDIAKLLARLQRHRQDADYSAEHVFTLAGATDELEAARRFVAAARTHLIRGGWLPAG